MKKNTVKKIFVFFMILLPLQYALVGIVGYNVSEPWPAFVFPGFKSVYTTTDQIEIEKTEFIAISEGNRYQLDTKKLFSGVKESQRLGFIKTNFADSMRVKNFDTESKKWLKERIVVSYPSLSQPESLEISWIRETFTRTDLKRTSVSEEVVSKFRLEL